MELLTAAQQGDEKAFGSLIDPFRGELHAHCYRMLGSVHDAEDALQEASLRAWRGLARFEGRSSLRSWLYTIATNTCLNHIARRPKRVLPLDYGPSHGPRRRRRRAAHRVGLGRALPGRAPGRRGRLRRARGALRAARERGARVHRRRPAPARHAARRADPARRARLLGARGGGVARHDGRVGEQRAAAGAQDRSTSASPSAASRPRCAHSATRSCASSSRATWTRCSAATSTRSSRCWPRTPRGRCRRSRRGSPASTRSGGSSSSGRCRASSAGATCPTRVNGQPASAAYSWVEAEQAYLPFALDVLHVRGRPDQGDHLVHLALHGQPRPRVLRALPRPAARPRERGGVRALRPAWAPGLRARSSTAH